MESNSKEIRLGIDRISELPDFILSIILSHLPTKNAIGTSILSTRWKNLIEFGFVPVKLDINESLLFLNPMQYSPASLSFLAFVDKLLNVTLSDVACVEEIILNCNKKYDEDKVVSWVNAALRLTVRHLDLKVIRLHDSKALFCSLNGCTTLVTLQLWARSSLLKVPDDFRLPNLKTLDLIELVIFDDDEGDQLQKFMEGCPALECLSLHRCKFYYDDTCIIKCPLLKKLVIEGYWEQSSTDLTLDAPNLESLIYNGFLATYNLVCDFKSLHTTHICIRPSQEQKGIWLSAEDRYDHERRYLNGTTNIVASCSSTIRLYLSDSTIDALLDSHHVPLPFFPNLTWLSLDYLCWPILGRLLQNAPNLEQLIIKEVRPSLCDILYKPDFSFILPMVILPDKAVKEKQMVHESSYEVFQFSLNPNQTSALIGFREYYGSFRSFSRLLRIPPECLVLHLKRIEFRVFEGHTDEFKSVEYFLKNGKVLQNLILHCVPPNDVSILRRLRKLPKQTKTCQIECIME